MPLCTLHLISLTPQSSIPDFLSALSTTTLKPLTIARVIRWIITPTHLSTCLLDQRWDLLITLSTTDPLPTTLEKYIAAQWTVTAGVPSRIVSNFSTKNQKLLHPKTNEVLDRTRDLQNPRVASSSQNLELSPELRTWIVEGNGKKDVSGAVSMLNLLSFNSGKKESYLQYGKAFAEDIGAKRGGDAKIVGTVVGVKGVDGREESGWDEVAIAHYPSIEHFGDMLASEDYQAVNHKFRVPALRDTFILCTNEVDLVRDESVRAKL